MARVVGVLDETCATTFPAGPGRVRAGEHRLLHGCGDYNRTNGQDDRVAFRVNVEDRGGRGAGQNAGSLPDVWIEIWIGECANADDRCDLLRADAIPDERPTSRMEAT
jgi:hypothetical protein